MYVYVTCNGDYIDGNKENNVLYDVVVVQFACVYVVVVVNLSEGLGKVVVLF